MMCLKIFLQNSGCAFAFSLVIDDVIMRFNAVLLLKSGHTNEIKWLHPKAHMYAAFCCCQKWEFLRSEMERIGLSLDKFLRGGGVGSGNWKHFFVWPNQEHINQKPLTTQYIWGCAWCRRCPSQPGQKVGVWQADWNPVCPGRPKK